MLKADYKNLPENPGVYLMKDGEGRILYVGKAGNLRRRVSSYFERPHDVRIEALVAKIREIDFEETETALEALIREAELIKRLTPPFNVREKDDKSFLYIEITKEKFPRVLLVRGSDGAGGETFGPFTSASNVREALRILRKIFSWSLHDPKTVGTFKRPCFDYEVGLCPGTCVNKISREEYKKNIAHLKLFLAGKKQRLIAMLEKEMKAASRAMDFEKAATLRGQVFALRHIRDIALISENESLVQDGGDADAGASEEGKPYRIEGYDISNTSGTSAVGSMVVFENDAPNKNEYRKFKIKTVFEPNDVGMLTEVLTRRFRHSSPAERTPDRWPMPDLILIDGGLAQVNAAKRVIMRAGFRIPILGIAKGPERKRNDIIGAIPKRTKKGTLIRVRDEAHRFAISYHKKLRGREFLK